MDITVGANDVSGRIRRTGGALPLDLPTNDCCMMKRGAAAACLVPGIFRLNSPRGLPNVGTARDGSPE